MGIFFRDAIPRTAMIAYTENNVTGLLRKNPIIYHGYEKEGYKR